MLRFSQWPTWVAGAVMSVGLIACGGGGDSGDAQMPSNPADPSTPSALNLEYKILDASKGLDLYGNPYAGKSGGVYGLAQFNMMGEQGYRLLQMSCTESCAVPKIYQNNYYVKDAQILRKYQYKSSAVPQTQVEIETLLGNMGKQGYRLKFQWVEIVPESEALTNYVDSFVFEKAETQNIVFDYAIQPGSILNDPEVIETFLAKNPTYLYWGEVRLKDGSVLTVLERRSDATNARYTYQSKTLPDGIALVYAEITKMAEQGWWLVTPADSGRAIFVKDLSQNSQFTVRVVAGSTPEDFAKQADQGFVYRGGDTYLPNLAKVASGKIAYDAMNFYSTAVNCQGVLCSDYLGWGQNVGHTFSTMESIPYKEAAVPENSSYMVMPADARSANVNTGNPYAKNAQGRFDLDQINEMGEKGFRLVYAYQWGKETREGYYANNIYYKAGDIYQYESYPRPTTQIALTDLLQKMSLSGYRYWGEWGQDWITLSGVVSGSRDVKANVLFEKNLSHPTAYSYQIGSLGSSPSDTSTNQGYLYLSDFEVIYNGAVPLFVKSSDDQNSQYEYSVNDSRYYVNYLPDRLISFETAGKSGWLPLDHSLVRVLGQNASYTLSYQDYPNARGGDQNLWGDLDENFKQGFIFSGGQGSGTLVINGSVYEHTVMRYIQSSSCTKLLCRAIENKW